MTHEDNSPLVQAFRRMSERVSTHDCPSAERIWDAARLALPLGERLAIIDHTAVCPMCAEAWRLAIALPHGGAVVGSQERRRFFKPSRWVLGLAAVLLVTVGLVFVWWRSRPIVVDQRPTHVATQPAPGAPGASEPAARMQQQPPEQERLDAQARLKEEERLKGQDQLQEQDRSQEQARTLQRVAEEQARQFAAANRGTRLSRESVAAKASPPTSTDRPGAAHAAESRAPGATGRREQAQPSSPEERRRPGLTDRGANFKPRWSAREEMDVEAALQVLGQYLAAWNRRDAAAIARFDASIDAQALARSFDNIAEQFTTCLIGVMRPVSADRVVIECDWRRQILKTQAGSVPPDETGVATFTFERRGSRWFLVNRQFEER